MIPQVHKLARFPVEQPPTDAQQRWCNSFIVYHGDTFWEIVPGWAPRETVVRWSPVPPPHERPLDVLYERTPLEFALSMFVDGRNTADVVSALRLALDKGGYTAPLASALAWDTVRVAYELCTDQLWPTQDMGPEALEGQRKTGEAPPVPIPEPPPALTSLAQGLSEEALAALADHVVARRLKDDESLDDVVHATEAELVDVGVEARKARHLAIVAIRDVLELPLIPAMKESEPPPEKELPEDPAPIHDVLRPFIRHALQCGADAETLVAALLVPSRLGGVAWTLQDALRTVLAEVQSDLSHPWTNPLMAYTLNRTVSGVGEYTLMSRLKGRLAMASEELATKTARTWMRYAERTRDKIWNTVVEARKLERQRLESDSPPDDQAPPEGT